MPPDTIQPFGDGIGDMRDGRVDAAKAVLVVLVVLGHFLEQMPGGKAFAIYRWLYLFHIPAFVFLSGLVSADTLDPRRGGKLLAMVALPYLIHQFAAQWLDATVMDEAFKFSPSKPYWALWYLVALVIWRLTLPMLLGTGAPLLVACVISLGAGLLPDIGYLWSASRAAVFYPFFVLGYLYASREGIRLPPASFSIGAAGLVLVAVVGYLTRGVPQTWLYGASSYASLKMTPWEGLAMRGLQLAAGGIGVFAFLRLVVAPRWLSALGGYTMAVYIGHVYLLKAAQSFDLFDGITRLDGLALTGAALAITAGIVALTRAAGQIAPWLFDFSWAVEATKRAAARMRPSPGAA
jgi:fucose 4-O-acetylase-like acetyltransferase